MNKDNCTRDTYKRWMLNFYWETAEKDETFFFDTKENMLKFVNLANDIRIEKMWHLEEVDKDALPKKKREIRLEDLDDNQFYTFDEIFVEGNDHLNFVWEMWFDVDKYFGTDTREKDEWINFYTDWYPDGHIEAMYFIEGDDCSVGVKWELTQEEEKLIRSKMTARINDVGYGSLAEMYYELCVSDGEEE